MAKWKKIKAALAAPPAPSRSRKIRPIAVLLPTIGAVSIVALAASAADVLLHGHVNTARPETFLSDKYGAAANDPAVADALRKAQGGQQLTRDEIKAKTEADEALQNGVWKPGADPTMALMYGYVPPNMSPEQAATMAKHLPKIPRMQRPMSPDEMAGEPNPDLQMAGTSEPMSPYVPIPDSLAAASRQPNTRQLSLIPQFPMSPEQLVGGPGMAPTMMGAPVMPYGANKRAIEEANQRQIEDYLRDRLGPGYVSPFQKNHNPRPQQVVTKTEGGKHVVESDHQSVVGVCDASGNEITSIQYDPWGQHTVLSGGTVMPAFMYKGMYWHDRSKKYLTLYRAYDPALGRWLSRDPIGEFAGIPRQSASLSVPAYSTDGTLYLSRNFLIYSDGADFEPYARAASSNLYTYVSNNPVNRRDPSGLCPLPPPLLPPLPDEVDPDIKYPPGTRLAPPPGPVPPPHFIRQNPFETPYNRTPEIPVY